MILFYSPLLSITKSKTLTSFNYPRYLDVLFRLNINGKLPDNYVKWNETVNTFYTLSSADKTILDALGMMAVTPEQINKIKTDLVELEKEHIDYVPEKGESQDATAKKNKAFDD